MKWEIGFSRDAEKFLKRENHRAEAVAEIINFLKRMRGEPVSVDVKKLKGDWQGFLQDKKGKAQNNFRTGLSRAFHLHRTDIPLFPFHSVIHFSSFDPCNS
jgi:hypothetical protein